LIYFFTVPQSAIIEIEKILDLNWEAKLAGGELKVIWRALRISNIQQISSQRSLKGIQE